MDNNTKYTPKEYTPAQLEYLNNQEKVKEYFAKKVQTNLTTIQTIIEQKKSSGEQPKNNSNTKYYIAEDGSIFKQNIDNITFYRLELSKFIWFPDPTIIDLFYNNDLSFTELPTFQDYFDELIPEKEITSKAP